MHAILSKLDPASSETVHKLWEQLRESCGLRAIYETPIPHFSWFVAEQINFERASPILSQIVGQQSSMTLHTFGVGLFSGATPTLYLPIVKSREMIALHETLWDQITPFSKQVKLYYSPMLWVPHITLALKDLTRENLACAVEAIGFEPIELFITVNNLAFAENEVEVIGKILKDYPFPLAHRS